MYTINTPYYTDKKVKKLIDEAHEKAAMCYAKIGQNQLPKKVRGKLQKEKDYCHDYEFKVLSKLEEKDPEYINKILEIMSDD